MLYHSATCSALVPAPLIGWCKTHSVDVVFKSETQTPCLKKSAWLLLLRSSHFLTASLPGLSTWRRVLHARYQGEGLAGFTRLSRGTWVGRVARTAKPGDSVPLLRPGEASAPPLTAPEGTAWHRQLQPITCALSHPCSKLQKVPEPAPPEASVTAEPLHTSPGLMVQGRLPQFPRKHVVI